MYVNFYHSNLTIKFIVSFEAQFRFINFYHVSQIPTYEVNKGSCLNM